MEISVVTYFFACVGAFAAARWFGKFFTPGKHQVMAIFVASVVLVLGVLV